MNDVNQKCLQDCFAGKRLAFMTQLKHHFAVVTVPYDLEDPDLFQGTFLLLEDNFKNLDEVETYMKDKGLDYVSPYRQRDLLA